MISLLYSDKQMKSWRSDVYKHFNSPPDILIAKGVVKYKFSCKSHPYVFFVQSSSIKCFTQCIRSSDPVIRARDDVSTSNLKRHVTRCDGQLAPPGGRINEFAHGSTYNKAEFRYLATLWVAQCHRPYAIVEDPPLNRMFRMLYSQVEVPSAVTVSRDVKEVYEVAKKEVGKVLQACFSQSSVSTCL
jgi:hypothetical protein